MSSKNIDNEDQEMAVKVVSRYAHRSLKHVLYELVISTNNINRTDKVQNGSKTHQLETFSTNTVSRLAFEDGKCLLVKISGIFSFALLLMRDITFFEKLSETRVGVMKKQHQILIGTSLCTSSSGKVFRSLRIFFLYMAKNMSFRRQIQPNDS